MWNHSLHRLKDLLLKTVLNSWNKSYSSIFKKKDYTIFRIGFHVSAKLNNNNKSKQTFVSFIKTKITAWFFEYKRRRKNKIGKQAAAAQDFELRGVKNCPILCVRLKTMAVFRPEKKKRLTPKSFSHCSRIPWEYQRDRLPHHDDRYCLKSKGYVCVCGDDHDEAEGWWNGSWTDLTDFIKVWSVGVVYYNSESVVYNNYQCIENFFH